MFKNSEWLEIILLVIFGICVGLLIIFLANAQWSTEQILNKPLGEVTLGELMGILMVLVFINIIFGRKN